MAFVKIAAVLACFVAAQIGQIAAAPRGDTGPDNACREQQGDIVFVLDESSSIYPPNFRKVLKFISDVTRVFHISPETMQVGILSFSNEPHIEFALNRYSDAQGVRSGIQKITQATGNTNTAGALLTMRKKMFRPDMGARPEVPKIGVVITDGSSDSPRGTALEAKFAQGEGITLYAIGIGEKANLTELNLIASEPDSTHAFAVPDYQALENIKNLLAQSACKELNPGTSTPAVFTEPRTTKPVKIKDTPAPTTPSPSPSTASPTPSTEAPVTTERMINIEPKTTQAPKCSRTDVVFVVPESAGTINLNTILHFIHAVTSGLDIGDDAFQVGMAPLICHSLSGFELDIHRNKDKLLLRLDQSKFKKPNTAGQLHHVRTRMFSTCNGARAGARRVAIVFVDHESDDVTETVLEAGLARHSGIEIVVVAVGKKYNKDEVKAIAGYYPRSHLIKVDCYNDLSHIKSKIIAMLREFCEKEKC